MSSLLDTLFRQLRVGNSFFEFAANRQGVSDQQQFHCPIDNQT
jgi:hypothetical protein